MPCCARLIALALLLPACLPLSQRQAWAARPMITDDARVVDPRSCQVETWSRRNPGSTEFWMLPACSIAERTEFTAGGALGRDESGTHTTDAVLQVKHLFRPLTDTQWGVGMSAGHVSHPAVNRRSNLLGDLYANLLLSAPLRGEAVVAHFNLGWLNERAASSHRMTWGVGFEARMAPRVYAIGESFGQDAGRPWWQAGVRYWILPGRVQLDATVGDRWGGAGGEHWFTIGLRLLSPPFLH